MITPQILQPFLQSNSTIIVGFSGGPDSICLLSLLHKVSQEFNLKIIAAHLNHQWRTESDQDAAWCENFCQQRNITCVIATPDQLTVSLKFNGSKEEIGRALRQAFFLQLAQQHQAQQIFLAHHQDDQLETFFIRLLRGSSITGLCGMQPHNKLFVRPLLNVRKQEILDYLAHHQIDFLTDATNLSLNFLRNRIRHQLLAQLATIDQRAQKNIISTMQKLQKTECFLEQLTQQEIQKLAHPKQQNLMHLKDFLELHEVLQHRILLQSLITAGIKFTPSSALLQEMMRFLKSSSKNRHQLSPNSSLCKKSNYFYFTTD